MKLVALFFLAVPVLSQQQGIFTFRSPNGAFTLENFARVSLVPSGLHGEVAGSSFRARWRDRGLELTGQNAVIDAGKDAKGNYFLTSANVSGQGTITQDTHAAYDFAAESAKAGHVALAPESPNQSRMVLTSDRFTFAGDEAQGTITLPVPFAINRQAHTVGSTTIKKQKVPVIGDDTIELHGASGLISFAVPTMGADSLKTGSVEGPITAHFVRKSTTNGKPDPDTVLDGTADRLDLDFVSPVHTITISGNVTMNGTSSAYSGFTRASKAVIVFGADGKIERIDMTGNPTDTVIKPHGTGGGG